MWTMYVADVCIPDALNTYPTASVAHIPFVVLCALFSMTFHRYPKCVTYTIIFVASEMDHDSEPNNNTACTTAR